ncbi:MAG: GIY-YIG nuclease family protein, partial [Planctomycetota bacterium]
MSERRPQTIQFFLPQGEPRGIRIAEITTRIVQAVYIPRNKLAEAADRAELRNVGVYFLFGQPEEAAKGIVYIGEAEDCYARLKQHNAQKDFWQQAIAIVSKTSSFTKAHVRYLEWYCIRQARQVGRYALDNGNDGGEPFTTEPMRADLMDAFDTLNVLTSALGFPVVESRPRREAAEIFHLSGKEAEGKGQMVEDGFTVLAGSRARKETVASVGEWLKNSRQELLSAGILQEEGDQLVFVEDYTFNSPSGAAMAILGRTANGWT